MATFKNGNEGLEMYYEREKQKGLYSYRSKDINIKMHYRIEFTRNQKVIDVMDTAEFDFNMLDAREFDYLEDAIRLWNTLYYDKTCLYVMLFESVIVDGEIVLEQFKDMTLPTVLDDISRERVKSVELINSLYQEENEKLIKLLGKCNFQKDKITDEDMKLINKIMNKETKGS